jgi:hypothetical protein
MSFSDRTSSSPSATSFKICSRSINNGNQFINEHPSLMVPILLWSFAASLSTSASCALHPQCITSRDLALSFCLPDPRRQSPHPYTGQLCLGGARSAAWWRTGTGRLGLSSALLILPDTMQNERERMWRLTSLSQPPNADYPTSICLLTLTS